SAIHVCFYSPPFGIIPIELSETYPLYQYEYAYPPDAETVKYVAERILEYIAAAPYVKIIILMEKGSWSERLVDLVVKESHEREIEAEILPLDAHSLKLKKN
ncbi:MAG: hypothetical protein QXG68_04340, partial [Candidatus Bathyarchaeia archaeon]